MDQETVQQIANLVDALPRGREEALVSAQQLAREFAMKLASRLQDPLNEEVQKRAEACGKNVMKKQETARWVNNTLQALNLEIEHPETGNPSMILAINDKWGGKFCLEDKITKKRSLTNEIFPLILKPRESLMDTKNFPTLGMR